MASVERSPHAHLVRLHMLFGWSALLVSLSLGLVLEALHGLKLGWYLGGDAETRRLMWTLAHTHGTLLAVVNIAFAATLATLLSTTAAGSMRLSSLALMGASVLMPAGFMLGGLFIYANDPGLGIFLVPPGGILLFVAVATVVWRLMRLPRVN